MKKSFERKVLENLEPYKYIKAEYKIKLDANESQFNLSDKVRERLCKYITGEFNANFYPNSDCDLLRDTIAKHYGLKSENIVVGAGSDQIIDIIYKAFLNQGDRVVVPYPTFSMYELTAKVYEGTPVRVKIASNGGYEYAVSKFIDTIKNEKAKIAFICTPNSPTGNTMSLKEIRQVIEACPDTLIVVDEAYGEFTNQTAISLVNEYNNLIILKTFSKAYGLAAARVGYSVSCNETADSLNKVKPPYNVAALSQIMAQYVLDDVEESGKRIKDIVLQRNSLFEELKKIQGVKVFPSEANFLLIKVEDSQKAYKALLDNGIVAINFGDKEDLENCMRISVGLDWQNKLILDSLRLIKEGN
ncbi:MAG: histidinol-phosphate transaminase [Ignavibacteriales bacterium]